MCVLKLVTCFTCMISVTTTFPMLPSRDLSDLTGMAMCQAKMEGSFIKEKREEACRGRQLTGRLCLSLHSSSSKESGGRGECAHGYQ